MKIYIVIDACSGEDYSADEPNVLFVSTNFKEAKEFYYNEISNWEDGMKNYDSKKSRFVYECTDYDGDSHRVMKLVKQEI